MITFAERQALVGLSEADEYEITLVERVRQRRLARQETSGRAPLA
jgi:hypothetical protein